VPRSSFKFVIEEVEMGQNRMRNAERVDTNIHLMIKPYWQHYGEDQND